MLVFEEGEAGRNGIDGDQVTGVQSNNHPELTVWVSNLVKAHQSFTPEQVKELRKRLLAEANGAKAGLDSVLVSLLTSWQGGREYLASKLAVAISDFPEEYVRSFDQVSEGQERRNAMKSLEKVLLQEGDAVGLEKAYNAMNPGPERNSMAVAIVDNSLRSGNFKEGLNAIDRFDLPEDRQAGLWLLIGKVERIGIENLDEEALLELTEKAKAEGMNGLLEGALKRIAKAKKKKLTEED